MKKTTKYMLFILVFLLFSILFILNTPILASESSVITDGMIYFIRNVGSGKMLNVNLASDANGTNVIQWTYDTSTEQKFRMVYYTNKDAYRIYAMCSDKGANRVLDVLRTGGSSSGVIQSGNNVDIWTTGDDACQYFKIYNHGDGKVSIRLNSNTNLALTTYGNQNGSGAGTSSTSNGNVFISTWNGSDNQLWDFISVGGTPAYPYRMTKGIGNQTYFVDATATVYANDIATGAAKWSPTVKLSKASNNSSTAVDFYSTYDKFYKDKYNQDIGTWAAATTYHIPSTENLIDGNLRGWSFAIVRINNDKYPTSNNQEDKYALIAHEIRTCIWIKTLLSFR